MNRITEAELLLGYYKPWLTAEQKEREENASGAINSVLLAALLHDEDNSSLEEQILQMLWEGGPAPTQK